MLQSHFGSSTTAPLLLGLLLVSCSLPGCSTPKQRQQPPIDCAQQDAYEFSPISPTFWYGFGDETPGAYDGAEDGVPPPAEEGAERSRPPDPVGLVKHFETPTVCNHPADMLLKGHGHRHWGFAWGSEVRFRANPYRAGEEAAANYQGVAFWARSATQADKILTLNIETAQTAKPGDADPAKEHADDCKTPVVEEGAATYRMDTSGNLIPSSGVPAPDECGNPFLRQFTTTDDWQLFLLPFDSFWQEAQPNRARHGLDASSIYQFAFRAEKEKHIEMWIENFSFYRPAGESSGGAAGAPGTGTGEGGASGAAN